MEISQATHDVENQAPPLAPYNVFEADLALREAVEREGGGWGVDRLRDTGELAGTAEALDALRARRAQRADPAHPRPLRQPHRRGRARPVLALVPAPGDRARDPLASLARPAARRPRGARRRCSSSGARSNSGRDVPRVDDLLRDSRAARGARAGRRVGAAHHEAELRRRRARGHGDDREAGRLGRAREHHPRRRRTATAWEITGHKWFCSYPPVRRLPHARAGAGGPVVLPDRGARPRLPHPAPEGQARHALAALERGRVPRRARPARGRGGPRRRRRSSGWSTTPGSTA